MVVTGECMLKVVVWRLRSMGLPVGISRWLVIILALVGVLMISMASRRDWRPLHHSFLESHEVDLDLVEHKQRNWTDSELIAAAAKEEGRRRPGRERIAFLFIVRGEIPHEAIWRRFFERHEGEYSLYVHAKPGYVFPKGSLFEGRQIPSQECPRFSRGIVDAMRRLYAHALIDARYNNAWFVNVCESAVPIRSFEFVYDYLMRSPVSFVESFFPVARHSFEKDSPAFNATDLRKGELWMALRRKHVRVVVCDGEVYGIFDAYCKVSPWRKKYCTWDEQYVQTLLALRDPQGIANRTVMYVNWTGIHTGSPKVLEPRVDVVQDLQLREHDTDGERHDTAFDNTTYSCAWRGVSPWPCFLFARKFKASATPRFLALGPDILGY